MLSAGAGAFNVRMTVLMPIFSVRAVSRTPAPLKAHFSDLVFNSRFTGLVTVSELKTPGDSHGNGIDHVLLGSARDGKPERTGNGGNES